MVYRFCVASDAYNADPFQEAESSLAYAARLLERDPDAAALLVNSVLPALIDAWYGRQGDYPPARDQLLRDLAERAPDVAESLRLALRASGSHERVAAAKHLLACARGQAELAAR